MDFDRLATVMRRLALEAGDRIMEIYNSPDFEVKTKSDDSPVTAADEAADALISEGLAEAFPQVTLITEEQGVTHWQTATHFLIVDPLDGTKEFVQRRGDFTVNIAYVEHGVPLRGVVYAPAKGRLFYTLADGRAIEEMGPVFDKETRASRCRFRFRCPITARLWWWPRNRTAIRRLTITSRNMR